MKEKEETFISYIFRYSSYSSKKKKNKIFLQTLPRRISSNSLDGNTRKHQIILLSKPHLSIHPYFIVTRLNKIFNWAVHPRGLVKPSTSRAISR